jgi:hypothetical protein
MKTVITICNYDKYQDVQDETGHMPGQQIGHKPDRNRTAKEQGNKETREPNGSHTPISPGRLLRRRGSADACQARWKAKGCEQGDLRAPRRRRAADLGRLPRDAVPNGRPGFRDRGRRVPP